MSIFQYVIIFTLFQSAYSWAEENKKGSNVLNFEEEVIQGERKNLDLFIQLDLGSPNLDSVILQRENFNDFHQLEYNRRPKFKPKK